MCGISGLFSFEKPVPAKELRAMNALIRHRGPDDEGYAFVSGSSIELAGGTDTPEEVYAYESAYKPVRSENVTTSMIGLGHRRLSILDLSPCGHQPMCDQTQTHYIVFNGEVYNYKEIREELESRGYTFSSRTDTEVVLKAYCCWGAECLQRFNGMFAFLIVDLKKNKLFAARDRFGIKPLYYWKSPEGFLAFASEIKQFSALSSWEARINPQMAYDFLAFSLSDHTEQTMFDGVLQVPAGYCAEVGLADLKNFSCRKWYEIPEAGSVPTVSFEETAEKFRALFMSSLDLRHRADVPVGTALSGGLDSSSIVCSLHELMGGVGNAFHSFSSISDDPRYDEQEYIRLVVDQCNVIPNYVKPDTVKLFDMLDDIVWHQDEPFYSSSIYAEWSVFGLVQKTPVTVTLDGHGADELLAGYHMFFAVYLAELLGKFSVGKLVSVSRAIWKQYGYSPVWTMKFLFDYLMPNRLRQSARKASGKMHERPEWMDVSALGNICLTDPYERYRFNTTSLTSVRRTQLRNTSLPVQLHWADRDSMAHSVESRVPFLDHRLVEFALQTPSAHIILDASTKRILREAMKGILPEPIRGRMDKMGFVTPEEVWITKEDPERFREEIRNAVKVSGGLLSDRAVDIGDQMIAGRIPFSFYIWRLTSFGRWIDRFDVKV